MPNSEPSLRPDEFLEFFELPVFTRRWQQLGLDDESDLSELQWQIMEHPAQAKLVRGTQAIRKLRFAPSRWRMGKSGAARVLYVYFVELGVVILALVYGKDEVDNISAAVKKYLNKLVDQVEMELRRRRSRTP